MLGFYSTLDLLSQANSQYTTNNTDNNNKSFLFRMTRYAVLSGKLAKRQCGVMAKIVDFESHLCQVLDVSLH